MRRASSIRPRGGYCGVGRGRRVSDCYAYDGANRLESAWSITGSGCEDTYAAQQSAGGFAAGELALQSAWSYSSTGRVDAVTDYLDATATSTVTYHYDGDTSHPNAVDSITDTNEATTASYTYDDAGRMTSRTVGSDTTDFTWDVSSNLVATSGDGGERVYLYDASGQRVAQIKTDAATGDPATATAYFGATEVTDPNTSAARDGRPDCDPVVHLRGCDRRRAGVERFHVVVVAAVRRPAGSATVMMPLARDGNGDVAAATTTELNGATRNAYTPYGATRGSGTSAENDNLAGTDHGWLNQVTDEASTGLIYLNARYYDPTLARFLSPDPVIKARDPRTLDPYRYAENNPITYTDANGMCSTNGNWAYVGGVLEPPCNTSNYAPGAAPSYAVATPRTADRNHGQSGYALTANDAMNVMEMYDALAQQKIADEGHFTWGDAWHAAAPAVASIAVGLVVGTACLGGGAVTAGAMLVVCGAIAGSASGMTHYFTSTPSDEWTSGGAATSARGVELLAPRLEDCSGGPVR